MNRRILTIQKQLLSRRIWLAAALTVYQLLYYPVAVVMLIARSNENAAITRFTERQALLQRLTEVSQWIGVRQSFAFTAILFGIIIALQGYAWLFNTEKLDFYESQPMSRRDRFFHLYWNGVLLYAVPMIIFLALSVLLAAAMGGMDRIILAETAFMCVRMLLMFLASYHLGILAVMLTGSMPVTILLAVVMLAAEKVLPMILSEYASDYFATYVSETMGSTGELYRGLLHFSPAANLIEESQLVQISRALRSFGYRPMNAVYLATYLKATYAMDLSHLIGGAIMLAAAYALYRRRHAESAGKAIIHRPVQTCLRILSAFVTAMLAGALVFRVFNGSGVGSTGSVKTVFIICGMLFAGVAAAGVMQCVISLDVKKFFDRWWEIAAALALTMAVFCIYRFDLTGYDRYVPTLGKVDSAVLYVYTENDGYTWPPERMTDELRGYSYYDYTSPDEYASRYMYLTDIPAVEKITAAGMECQRQRFHTGEANDGSGWYGIVRYRMKNGTQTARRICIPSDIDPQAMDAVTGSREYREGIIPIYHELFTEEDYASGRLVFSNYAQEAAADGALFESFANAYRKDLEQYCYTFARDTQSVGSVALRIYENGYSEAESIYKVYAGYDNTIAWLKENHIWLEPVSASDIQSVLVNYWPEDGESYTSMRYESRDEIREVLENASFYSSAAAWKDPERFDDRYDVTLLLDPQSESGEAKDRLYMDDFNRIGMRFVKDRIPEFMLKD